MKQFWLNLAAVFILIHSVPLAAFAIDPPLRDARKLASPKNEKFVRVTTARVVLADYPLLKHDFPELRNMSNDQIDGWLLDHVANVSLPQASQETVNTHVQTGQQVDGYRPAEYGRAAVFKAGSGLIDVKGSGSVNPAQADHGNGVATVGEGIREFIVDKMVNKILHANGTGMDTVGTYGVIDYGFDVRHADGSTSPAGEILRQAHERYSTPGSIYKSDISLPVEKILRKYGVTSAGVRVNEPVDKINIQGTADKIGILDFGAFIVEDHFSKPVRNLSQQEIVMDPSKPGFVQPDPALQLPIHMWGSTITNVADSKYDNLWIWSHELADNLRKGIAHRGDVEQHVKNFLEPVDHILAAHPVPATPLVNLSCSVADRVLNAFR